MPDEISINAADAIPFKNFREQIRIVNQEISKDRYVEVWDELGVVYSAEKWRKDNEL